MPKPYSSSLTDAQFETIAPLFVGQRLRRHRLRDVLDAVFYLVKTGCQWRLMPESFPPWQTVYYHFRRWRRSGLLRRMHTALRAVTRLRAGRRLDPSLGLLDAQVVKTSTQGGPRGYDGAKRVNGRKRHVVVDTMGLLMAVVVHSAHEADSQAAVRVLHRIASRRFVRVLADAGYGPTPKGLVWRVFGWALSVVPRSSEGRGFRVVPKRWIVERTFGWFEGYRRLSKDVERHTATSEAMIELAMSRLMLGRIR